MHYEKIKLRASFPALCGQSLEMLSEARKVHCIQTGEADFEWANYREPTLAAYVPDNSSEIDKNRTRTSIVFCPGGGYDGVSFREAEPVALAFLSRGYNVFVLDYDVAPVRYPAALLQLSAAVSLIRSKAEEFHVDVNKIAVGGFSAGGHLAASLGVFWNEPFIRNTLQIQPGSNRPNGLILAYPVISSGKYAHRGSFENLLGEHVPSQLVEKMSLENQVNGDVPPTFLWHTFEDGCVPVENSLLFAEALRHYKIPFELHVYPFGEHGMSLCNREVYGDGTAANPHCATWVNLCDEWLKLILK